MFKQITQNNVIRPFLLSDMCERVAGGMKRHFFTYPGHLSNDFKVFIYPNTYIFIDIIYLYRCMRV